MLALVRPVLPFDPQDSMRAPLMEALKDVRVNRQPMFHSSRGGDEDDEQDLAESKMRILHRQNIANKYYSDLMLEPTDHHKPVKNPDQQTTAKDYQFLMMRTDQLEERMNEMNSKIDWIMAQLEKQRSVRRRKQITPDTIDLN
ncbi:uncharacterized protein LOC144686103 [Cetorhinus maximus]